MAKLALQHGGAALVPGGAGEEARAVLNDARQEVEDLPGSPVKAGPSGVTAICEIAGDLGERAVLYKTLEDDVHDLDLARVLLEALTFVRERQAVGRRNLVVRGSVGGSAFPDPLDFLGPPAFGGALPEEVGRERAGESFTETPG